MTLPAFADANPGQLKQELEQAGLTLEAYRFKQLQEWIFVKRVDDFDQMSNIPHPLRQWLKQNYQISPLQLFQKQVSKDGTCKYLFRLSDGEMLETVLIPTSKRYTLCVSTQVGCAMACTFCASGLKGLTRNLSCAEIIAQPLEVLKESGLERINNIVFMGIGEPLQNWKELEKAIDVLNAPHLLNIGARKITVSTSGLLKGIEKLAAYPKQIELAISLHAPSDEVRNELMPINRKYPLKDLLQTCRTYVEKTKRQITFEYVMLKGINDRPEQAHQLADLLKGLCAKVNLIPYNATPQSAYECSLSQTIHSFEQILLSRGVPVTVRTPRGRDIDAACGQLRHKQAEPLDEQSI